jgi:hypothetical protein
MVLFYGAFLMVLFHGAFLMVLFHGAFLWCFSMVLYYGAFPWCFSMVLIMVLYYGAFLWCFSMVLFHGAFPWCFIMVLFLWCFFMVLFHCVYSWLYPTSPPPNQLALTHAFSGRRKMAAMLLNGAVSRDNATVRRFYWTPGHDARVAEAWVPHTTYQYAYMESVGFAEFIIYVSGVCRVYVSGIAVGVVLVSLQSAGMKS